MMATPVRRLWERCIARADNGVIACPVPRVREVLAVATVGILVSRVRVRLPSPDYRLAIQSTPGPNPGKGFRMTVA